MKRLSPIEMASFQERTVSFREGTPPKINIEPEIDGLDDDLDIFEGDRILRFHVNLWGCSK